MKRYISKRNLQLIVELLLNRISDLESRVSSLQAQITSVSNVSTLELTEKDYRDEEDNTVSEFNLDDWEFNYTANESGDNVIELILYTGASKRLKIPASIIDEDNDEYKIAIYNGDLFMDIRSNLRSVEFEAGIIFGQDMSGLFKDCLLLEEVDGLNYGNFSKTKDLSSFFKNCISLQNIDIDSIDTSSVVNMDYMFAACAELTDLYITSFSADSLISIVGMFQDCVSLEAVHVSEEFIDKITSDENIDDTDIFKDSSINTFTVD